MDLIWTLTILVVGYFVYYKLVKPNLLAGRNQPKIKRKPDSDAEYVDYEELDD